MPYCVRKAPGDPLEIDEHPVAPFLVQPGKRGGKEMIIGHGGELRPVCALLGGAFMLGASPGLISSGDVPGFTVSAGRDSGVARSVVVAGMHPGLAGGLMRTSDNRVSIAAMARAGQD